MSQSHGLQIFWCFLALAVLSSSLTHGQASLGTGRIEGTIVDTSGAAITDSTVVAASASTGISLTQKSDATGHFVFLGLVPASYQVTVQKPGFKTDISNDVLVKVGTTTNLRRELAVGGRAFVKISTLFRVCVHGEPPLAPQRLARQRTGCGRYH